MNGWKKQYSKLSPKEASEMGTSLSVQQEDRVLVMYENEKKSPLHTTVTITVVAPWKFCNYPFQL